MFDYICARGKSLALKGLPKAQHFLFHCFSIAAAIITALFCSVLVIGPAFAVGATNSQVSIPQRVATYSVNFTALVPAANTTDFFVIQGSATQVVRVKVLACVGSSTAAGNQRVYAIVRSSADTGGTFTTGTAVPADSLDAAATAAVYGYTANPTLGTTVGAVRAGALETSPQAGSIPNPLDLTFGLANDKEIVLRGTSQELALNAAGTSFVAGSSLDCFVEWTESGS